MTSVLTSGNIERLKNASKDKIGRIFGYVGGHSTSNNMESFPPLKRYIDLLFQGKNNTIGVKYFFLRIKQIIRNKTYLSES